MKKTKTTFCCVCGCSMKDNEGYPSPFNSDVLRLCERCRRGRSVIPFDRKPTIVYESLNDLLRLDILSDLLCDLADDHNFRLTDGFIEEIAALRGDIYCDLYGDPE